MQRRKEKRGRLDLFSCLKKQSINDARSALCHRGSHLMQMLRLLQLKIVQIK